MSALTHHDQSHPKERTYVRVALVLALITLAEIFASYITVADWIKIVALVGMSVVKFWVVAAYFMHLKFDNPALRKPFITGIFLAGTIYTIVLLSLTLHSRGGPA